MRKKSPWSTRLARSRKELLCQLRPPDCHQPPGRTPKCSLLFFFWFPLPLPCWYSQCFFSSKILNIDASSEIWLLPKSLPITALNVLSFLSNTAASTRRMLYPTHQAHVNRALWTAFRCLCFVSFIRPPVHMLVSVNRRSSRLPASFSPALHMAQAPTDGICII
jgi:hypothetical protein